MIKRPVENLVIYREQKKDRLGLAAVRSGEDSFPQGAGNLHKNNNILPIATYRLDVRKPERKQSKKVTTPLYNMGVTK